MGYDSTDSLKRSSSKGVTGLLTCLKTATLQPGYRCAGRFAVELRSSRKIGFVRRTFTLSHRLTFRQGEISAAAIFSICSGEVHGLPRTRLIVEADCLNIRTYYSREEGIPKPRLSMPQYG
jgi:hypothetical protein